MQNIRNFCIIAHIDHGKSTLADRFLELTGTVEKRKMQEQFLDQMELERERGITIKLQPVRMIYNRQAQEYILNLIDTPGHVDFSYEVSRSLAAVEGAILLIDATKGVQAQTLANLNLAKKQGLVIIPVINKIDLPNARVFETEDELENLLAIPREDMIKVSAKTGKNVDIVLENVVKKIPPPQIIKDALSLENSFRALIFDSSFDSYKGVIAYVRIFGGEIMAGERVKLFAGKTNSDVVEVGYFVPSPKREAKLSAGEIGYVATGLKDPNLVRVGDTIFKSEITEFKPLSGYNEPKPVVFASFFPENSNNYDLLKDALSKLKLTDASLLYETESSSGLGRGFRLGFLGMLHIEIVSERLRREFGLSLVISTPSVEYRVSMKNGEVLLVRSPSDLPDPSKIESIEEPIINLEILTPSSYLGAIMKLISGLRSRYEATDYLSKEVVILKYRAPLAEIITDFYDQLKSVSSGYASMNYEPFGYEVGDLIKLNILVAEEIVGPFSKIIPREKAYYEGRRIVEKLKEILPRQWFAVSIQAAIGGKIIARETIPALRKDVTDYLYGGDVTRKKKLLEKQKRGKAKMKDRGKVDIPQKVFLEMLKK